MEEEPASLEGNPDNSGHGDRDSDIIIETTRQGDEPNTDIETTGENEPGDEDRSEAGTGEADSVDETDESGLPGDQEDIFPKKSVLSEEDLERINKYKKFKKVDGSAYRRVNQFLRKHTYITAREWAIARLCADFTTRGGAEMTFIGENLPELVPFMIDTYTPQAVNQARSSFKRKVRKSGATFFYGALCGFFTADELDDILFESSEIARFLLEIEGTSIDIDDEIDIEDRITNVMRSVAEAASMLRTNKFDKDDMKKSTQETLKEFSGEDPDSHP